MALKLGSLSAAKSEPLFGVSVDELVARTKSATYVSPRSNDATTIELPRFLAELMTFLQRKGLECPNIFIDNGDESMLQLLKKLYNKDGHVSLEKYKQSMLSIAALIKVFLAELPEPLLTNNPQKTYSNITREIFQTILNLRFLYYRHKNKLSTMDLCNEIGPLIVGVEKSSNESTNAAELMKTLLLQLPYFSGECDDPISASDLPERRQSKRLSKTVSDERSSDNTSKSSKGRPKKTKRTRSITHSSSDGSITSSKTSTKANNALYDEILNSIIDSSINHVLFDQAIRVSFTYETKASNFNRKLYTVDKTEPSVQNTATIKDMDETAGGPNSARLASSRSLNRAVAAPT